MKRVVHQIWLNETPLPNHVGSWTRKWEVFTNAYCLWGWEDALQLLPNGLPDHIMEVYEANNRKILGYKIISDFLRLEVLYQFGGLYVDLDNQLRKDPWELLESEAAVAAAPVGWRFKASNSFLWAKDPEFPLWDRILKQGYEKAEQLNTNTPPPKPCMIAGPQRLSALMGPRVTLLPKPFLWFDWCDQRDGRTPPEGAYVVNAPWWRNKKQVRRRT